MTRILLVEDEMLLREVACEDLADAGFEVVAAADGREARAVLETDRDFALLFTDIKMPGGLDGYGLAAEAKLLIPGIKVIYASGFADADPRGPDERMLSKPYTRATLLALLRELGVSA
jgi:CheY-like chemotaxis protein